MSGSSKRLPGIDIARAIALIAMAIYHFSWNLSFFGFIDGAAATTGPLKWFARGIATSFLILVGMSLVLAMREGMRWPAFWRRFAMVCGGAALITVVTWFATPQSYVFFGILHHIALASLILLPFTSVHPAVTLLAAIAAYFIADFVSFESFNTMALYWTGLSTRTPASNDLVPIFPWISAGLLGVAFAKSGLLDRLPLLAQTPTARIGKALQWLGRHSLSFYLVHQPVLFGAVFLAAQLVPPQTALPDDFMSQCTAACEVQNGAIFCQAYCTCADRKISSAGDSPGQSLENVLLECENEALSILPQ